jgi:hypothetical protein
MSAEGGFIVQFRIASGCGEVLGGGVTQTFAITSSA